MAGNGTLRDPMEGLRDLCSAEIWKMEMSKVNEPPRRFEAGFFASEGYRAVDAMHHSGFAMETVGETSSVVWPGVFARRFVKAPGHGAPFMTTSVMMEARPRPSNYLSFKNTKNLDAYLVREDTVLISRSGTVGNVCLATKDIEGWAVSDDAIRVTVNEPDHLGPVYCFLQSPLGQFLLKKSQTGSVVRHIYEADVSTLPIPRLPRALREELTRLVKQASALRVEANRLLDEAEEMVYKQNYISIEDGSPAQEGGPEVQIVKARCLTETGRYKGNLRLDAGPFERSARRLRLYVEGRRSASLGDLVREVIYIGKVYRVPIEDAKRGAYLLSGKDLVFLRPEKEKILSVTNAAHIKRCLLQQGMILVSRSGTPGRVSMVYRNYEGFVGSEHILRILPNPKRLEPGYLFAFLSSSIGQRLLGSLIYGSVILTLSKEQLESIKIPIPDDLGASIGEVVSRAFDARADAERAEDQAFALFMTAVKQGRRTIESEWGDQY